MLEINKISAKLTFVNSIIETFQMKNSVFHLDDSAKKGFGMDVGVVDIFSKDSHWYGSVLLKVGVRIEANSPNETVADIENADFDVEMQVRGIFSAADDMPEEEFIKMLHLNGVTCVYSIARAKMEQITAAAFATGKIVLPMINILEFYKEKTAASQ
ncbi:MAG: hypothetical protein LBM28_07345 [Oscillospiraceae bacterium]|jgi:preprotein translocase subunit SecB|nr:hypothetical protein [Oscillospiraceae bacterium]